MAPARPQHRLRPGEEDFQYDLETVLRSNFMDARKPLDRLLRYERVLDTQRGWTPLAFEGARVVEVGCGPLLGWGPIAAYLGAARYVVAEPRLRHEVLRADAVRTRYFLPLHQQLEAVYARNVPFDEFLDRIAGRIEVHVSPIETCPLPPGSADIVVSQTVLQHVRDLDGALGVIAGASHEATRQLHAVNFTDHHTGPGDPFREIYRIEPDAYFSRDDLLNLKRPSEILAAFRRAGLPVDLVPYYRDADIETRTLASYWRRFDLDDLAIQIAFFAR